MPCRFRKLLNCRMKLEVNYPMNTLHKRFDEWMKENYGIPDEPDETPLGRQIMRVLVWYETEVGHSFDRMRRERITSVESWL